MWGTPGETVAVGKLALARLREELPQNREEAWRKVAKLALPGYLKPLITNHIRSIQRLQALTKGRGKLRLALLRAKESSPRGLVRVFTTRSGEDPDNTTRKGPYRAFTPSTEICKWCGRPKPHRTPADRSYHAHKMLLRVNALKRWRRRPDQELRRANTQAARAARLRQHEDALLAAHAANNPNYPRQLAVYGREGLVKRVRRAEWLRKHREQVRRWRAARKSKKNDPTSH